MAVGLLKEYLIEYYGKIMLSAGTVFLIVGLLFLNSFGSVLSALGVFLGIVLFLFGLSAQVGLFWVKIRSLNGLGTILFCISIVLFALSVAMIQFLEISGVRVINIVIRGVFIGSRLAISTNRPFVWLSTLSLRISMILFAASLIIKVYSAKRS